MIMYLMLTIFFMVLILSLVFLILGKLLNVKGVTDRDSQSPFECGFTTFIKYRLSFSLHFFLVALVFIIFDVELIVLFPYLSISNLTHLMSSSFMFFVFLLVLTLGLFNEWNQCILEWKK